MRVYGNMKSGNCHKVKFLLDLLEREHEWIEVDIFAGESRRPEFLAMNPNGKTPTLQLDDGRILAESNAILCYLAEDTAFFPAEAFERAKVLEWMFFEQSSHERHVAEARFIECFLPITHERRKELPMKQAKGRAVLEMLEQQLATRDWIAGERFTIADIALYPYTAMAEEGGISLQRLPSLGNWLERVAGKLGLENA